jgi:hypothetical protein
MEWKISNSCNLPRKDIIPGLSLPLKVCAASCCGIMVPRMEAREMIIKSAMASFTEAKKDHRGFLFVKIDHLLTLSYSLL